MTSTPSEPTPDHAEPTPPSSREPAAPSKSERKANDPLRASRTSGLYTAVIGLGVVLVLLIIFIAQNTDDGPIRFLVWEGTAPQAVLLLIAAAAGIFLTAMASSLRLLQVRRRVKRDRRG